MGLPKFALVGGPLSPPKPLVPFPAATPITPPETSKTRLATESAMYRLPEGSTAMPMGDSNCALMAGPFWPTGAPPPASVVMMPPETLRSR